MDPTGCPTGEFSSTVNSDVWCVNAGKLSLISAIMTLSVVIAALVPSHASTMMSYDVCSSLSSVYATWIVPVLG